jgi:hypothetical protein
MQVRKGWPAKAEILRPVGMPGWPTDRVLAKESSSFQGVRHWSAMQTELEGAA